MNNTITRIQLIPTSPENISGYLDVDQRVPVPINYAISDIRDPQKRTGSFSKTITLPGTKNNNSLLSYLFDINISEVIDPITSKPITFSVKKLYRCILLQDGIPLHENELSLQLIAVNKRQDQLTEDDIIEYEVVVRDDVAQFFTEVANRKLTDLDFDDLNHIINPTTIISSFSHTWVDGYKYLFPFKEQSNFYDFFEAVPSIYAKTYWDKIHADAGYTYEFFNNIEPQNFDGLIVPSNRPVIDQTISLSQNNKVIANRFNPQVKQIPSILVGLVERVSGFDYPSFTFNDNLLHNLPAVQDISNSLVSGLQWNPQLSTFTNNYKVKVSFNYEYRLVNPNLFPLTIDNITPQLTNINTSFIMELGVGPGSPAFSGPPNNSIDHNLLSPTYTVLGANNLTLFTGTYIGEIVLNATQVGQGWFPTFSTILGITLEAPNPFRLDVIIRDYSLTIELDTNTLILNQQVVVNETIPPDMKQSDFLRSIYTMYNLYVVPDKLLSNKLIYYTRDDFYRNGGNKDWTHKIARDVEQKLEFLPELRNREIVLSYKDDNDPANEFYKKFTQQTYGQKSVDFQIEWTKGVDRKEIEFSPTPGGLSNFNHYLPYIRREGNPRILLDNGVKAIPFNPINIISTYTTQNQPVFTATIFYPFASHFNKPTNPTFDINFGDNKWQKPTSTNPNPPSYYFYDVEVETLNNLYNQFWRNTIELIDKGQLLTAYFWLTPDDIFNLELNDVIRIDNSYWNINKIIDYDAGANRLTKVELITNSELLPLPLIPDSEIGDVEEPEPPEIEPGLFDLYSATTGSGGWSLNRRLTTSYSGPLFRVVRVSDLVELDITFNTFTGEVNQSELTTFIGSGTGRITRIYEQLGGNDLVQSNLVNMPRIINSGTLVQRGGNLVFEASTSEFFNFTTNLNDVNTEWSIWTVYEKSQFTNNAMLLASGGEYHWLDYGTTQAVQNIGSVAISPAIAPGNFVIWNSIIQSAVSASVWVNNSLRGSSAIAGGGTARSTLYPSSSFRGSTVYVGELVYYKTNQISDRANITTNINDFYGTY
jgi:hypothetical protein